MTEFHTPIVLEQVRTGTVQPFGSSGLQSAIQKEMRSGAVAVHELGLEGDQQADRNFHGGPDKAVLHYALENYDAWIDEAPQTRWMFSPGAFGENLVSRGINETNLCLGDIVTIGSAVMEITQPRQPCFKLNHRFQVPSMARRVQETGRTGWYYRVLTPGVISDGDRIQLLKRPHPDWTLRRVQEFLYRDTLNESALRELIALKPLSDAMREIFEKRLSESAPEAWEARLIGFSSSGTTVGEENRAGWRIVRVESIEQPTSSVRLVRLADPGGKPFEPFAPGAHISVELSNGIVRDYSLCGPVRDPDYEIAVSRVPESTGGSQFVHDSLMAGDVLSISPPQDRFSLDRQAGKIVMIAGGIGITPFLSMIEACVREQLDFEFHYCLRTRADALFAARLATLPAGRVQLHFSREPDSARLDVAKLLAHREERTHVYCCGPEALMKAVRKATTGWDPARVHFERFATKRASGRTFHIKIASTGQTIEVPPNLSILQVLRKAGFSIASSCETGSCGTCCVGLLDGRADHRDVILTDEQRRHEIAVCVSRSTDPLLTLDL